MAKNYYVILGVNVDASPEDIKAAFRRRAMELHPDRSGMGSAPFQEVQQAYGVLADPERRRRYDLRTGARRHAVPRTGPSPEPLVPERPRGEVIRPPEADRGFRDVSLAESFEVYHPSYDELFDRFWSNFEAATRPKAERLESLTVEVVLDPEEAQRGGDVRVWVPTRVTCSACGGHGAVGSYECWQCEGHGILTSEYPVTLEYPPGVQDGHAMRVPLTSFGVDNFYLTVLLRVSVERD